MAAASFTCPDVYTRGPRIFAVRGVYTVHPTLSSRDALFADGGDGLGRRDPAAPCKALSYVTYNLRKGPSSLAI
jgi:hypothetical protein